MGAKYDYYLTKYFENKKNKIPQLELSLLAYRRFAGQYTLQEEKHLTNKLSDESDIPSYSKILLNFSNKTHINLLTYLPYANPYQSLINIIYTEATEFRKRFVNDFSASKKKIKEYIHVYYKFVLTIYMLESLRSNIFEKGVSENVTLTASIKKDRLRGKARGICLEKNFPLLKIKNLITLIPDEKARMKVVVDYNKKNKRLQYHVNKIIQQIENIYINHGYTKVETSHTFKRAKRSKKYIQVEFHKDSKVINAPYNTYLANDYRSISGSIIYFNPQTKEVFRQANKDAIPVIFHLLHIQERTNLFMDGYIYSYTELGTNKEYYIKTESRFIYDIFYLKHPKIIREFEVIRFYIINRFNKLYKSNLQTEGISNYLQNLIDRRDFLKYVTDDLRKSIIGYNLNEIEIISSAINFYRSNTVYSYYLPNKPRSKNNLLVFRGKFNQFVSMCNKANIKSRSTNFVSSYLNKYSKFVLSKLNIKDISQQDLQRKLKNILRSDNISRLPDSIILKLANDLNVSVNIIKRTLKSINDATKK